MLTLDGILRRSNSPAGDGRLVPAVAQCGEPAQRGVGHRDIHPLRWADRLAVRLQLHDLGVFGVAPVRADDELEPARGHRRPERHLHPSAAPCLEGAKLREARSDRGGGAVDGHTPRRDAGVAAFLVPGVVDCNADDSVRLRQLEHHSVREGSTLGAGPARARTAVREVGSRPAAAVAAAHRDHRRAASPCQDIASRAGGPLRGHDCSQGKQHRRGECRSHEFLLRSLSSVILAGSTASPLPAVARASTE